jgi:hypothetical protein
MNVRLEKFRRSSGNSKEAGALSLARKRRRNMMRKLTYALAAVAALAIGVPTIANAEGFGVYVGGDHGYYRDRYDGPRVRMYGHDRGWHHGWYHHRDYDRGVVIRRHYWDDD